MSYTPLDSDYGMATFVAGLTKSGVHLAYQLGFETGATKSFSEHSKRTIDHELLLSDIHSVMEEFCLQNGWGFDWLQKDVDAAESLNPDAVMVITKGDKAFPFFIEIDRSKLDSHKRRDDDKKQAQVVSQSERYYRYYNSDECEKDYGFRQFRVLRIEPYAHRVQHLQGKLPNHRMFWITAKDQLLTNTADSIFATPKGDLFSFFELH